MPSSPIIRKGLCRSLFVRDIGLAVDLDQAEKIAAGMFQGGQRPAMNLTRKAPPYFTYRPSPLRFSLPCEPVALGEFTTSGHVECTVFDFGAVSLRYTTTLGGSLEVLPVLSQRLFDNPALLEHSRAVVASLAHAFTDVVYKPQPSEINEDYHVFQIEEIEGGGVRGPVDLLRAHGHVLAQILRAEPGSMSDEELRDALSGRVSYRPDDAAIIDWNAAVLLDSDAEDVASVLEYANVELLEMRFLDDRLDAILDETYRTLSTRAPRRGWLLRRSTRELARLAQFQMDSAILFEGVNNALKLIGDQYLARVYRTAAGRFHLAEHDASIERKLRTVESIYEKVRDHQATIRLETLEWIIILLIAVSLVMPFLLPH